MRSKIWVKERHFSHYITLSATFQDDLLQSAKENPFCHCCSMDYFQYDIYTLIQAFFPGEEIKVTFQEEIQKEFNGIWS